MLRPFSTKIVRFSSFFHAHLSVEFQAFRRVSSKSFQLNNRKTFQQNKTSNKSKSEAFFPVSSVDGITGKIALVTGGTEGIGLQCVKDLLTYGAKGVMIADSDDRKGYCRVKELSKQFGCEKVAFIQINPGSYTLLKNAFILTIGHFKDLNIVINNIKFRDNNWEDQIDETVKGVVLSTQLSLEFLSDGNGNKEGVLLNVAADCVETADTLPLYNAVQDFVVCFDRQLAEMKLHGSNIKVLTICSATFGSMGYNLAAVISKGVNGCVWTP